MRGEADGARLADAAIALIEKDILPGLAGDARFRMLMALSALRMSERERMLAGRLAEAEAAVLAAAGQTTMEALRDGLRRPDAVLDAGLHRALHADAAVRTAVTRPGALAAGERAGGPDGRR
jgi:Domain of unknown function (DUF6285)